MQYQAVHASPTSYETGIIYFYPVSYGNITHLYISMHYVLIMQVIIAFYTWLHKVILLLFGYLVLLFNIMFHNVVYFFFFSHNSVYLPLRC